MRAPLQAPVGSYLAIIDNNGVPRIHWRIDERVRIFRTHRDGRYPYSYGQAHSRNVIVLDENLEPVDKVTTVRPLHDTDLHDFVIKSNGNYLLMAYEPARPGYEPVHRFNNREPVQHDRGHKRFSDSGSHAGQRGGVQLELLGPHGGRRLHPAPFPPMTMRM